MFGHPDDAYNNSMMGATRKKRNDQSEEIDLNEIPMNRSKFSVKEEEETLLDAKNYVVPHGANNERKPEENGPKSAHTVEMKQSTTDDDDNCAITKDVNDSPESPDHNMKPDHDPSQKAGCFSIKHSLLLQRAIFVVIALALLAGGNICTVYIYQKDVSLLPHLQLKTLPKTSTEIRSLVSNNYTAPSNASKNVLMSEHSKTLSSFNGSNALKITGAKVHNVKCEYLRTKILRHQFPVKHTRCFRNFF